MPGQMMSTRMMSMSPLRAANSCRYTASAAVALAGWVKLRTVWPVFFAQASACFMQCSISGALAPQAMVAVAACNAGAKAPATSSARPVTRRWIKGMALQAVVLVGRSSQHIDPRRARGHAEAALRTAEARLRGGTPVGCSGGAVHRVQRPALAAGAGDGQRMRAGVDVDQHHHPRKA